MIDVIFIPDSSSNVASNVYSLLSNKWVKQTNEDGYSVDYEDAKIKFFDKIDEIESLRSEIDSKNIEAQNIEKLLNFKESININKYLYTKYKYENKDFETSNLRFLYKLYASYPGFQDLNNYISKKINKYWRTHFSDNVLSSDKYLINNYKSAIKQNNEIDINKNKLFDLNKSNCQKLSEYIKDYLSIYFDECINIKDIFLTGAIATEFYDDNSQIDIFVDLDISNKDNSFSDFLYRKQFFEDMLHFSKYKILGRSINVIFDKDKIINENLYCLTRRKWMSFKENNKTKIENISIHNLSHLSVHTKVF